GAGNANGYDGAGFLTGGNYSFNSGAAGSPLSLTPAANNYYSDYYTVNQTAPITFTYSSPQGDLTGTLYLTDLSMSSYPGTKGAFVRGVITITGGSLVAAVGRSSVTVSFLFILNGNINSLIGNST